MSRVAKRYSIEPRERRYVKGYGFLSFARATARRVAQPAGRALMDAAKKPVVKEFAKTASKRALQKSAEATGDLIGNKIADKIVKKQNKASPEPEIYIPPEKRQEIMDKLRLV